MEKVIVLGVQLNHRNNTAPKFQEIITNHGCNIKTRIGLHTVENGKCSPSGVILLELLGSDEEVDSLITDIKSLQDVEIQKMVFTR